MGLAQELVDGLEGIQKYRDTHRLEYYEPYPFQRAFHAGKAGCAYTNGNYEVHDGELAEEVALICANQIGKTLSAAMETAIHATGLYPDWWDGIRFEKEVTVLCCGKRNETVRDVIQNELLGDPFDEGAFGSGTIPIDKIGKTFRKAGVPNALTAVMVKHRNGKWSKVRFMAFEQGPDAFMGVRYDAAWPDEEPPSDIMSQLKRSQLTKKKKKIYSTFTPEEGFTDVVDQLLNNQAPYQAVVTATWNDAPHMTPERREIELAKFPAHEREMRSEGKPLMGSGLIFSTPDERIMVDRFHIPEWWPRISGIDFGQDHPFAWANLALDPDRDIIFVTDVYRESKALISTQVSTINKKSEKWIPIVWPHDGLITDPKSGVPLADIYREEGLNLTEERFTNPPSDFQKEGQGGNGVEVGLFEIGERMETERFKVFSDLDEWFQEKRQYHRKNVNGKYVIVKLRDDLMSATRYATMSLRHAQTRPVTRRPAKVSRGASNW